jgi:DNA-binding NtrC family response regulator
MRYPAIALVFTDIRMPGPMDGHDLALWVRLNHSRIIMMIATGGLSHRHAVSEPHVAATFIKPYQLQNVSERIRQANAGSLFSTRNSHIHVSRSSVHNEAPENIATLRHLATKVACAHERPRDISAEVAFPTGRPRQCYEKLTRGTSQDLLSPLRPFGSLIR